MESIQRIMVGAEIAWQEWPSDRLPEHPAQCCSVDDAALNTKPDDPACELVHHNQDPMRSQRGRLAPEQITTPQAVFQVAEEL